MARESPRWTGHLQPAVGGRRGEVGGVRNELCGHRTSGAGHHKISAHALGVSLPASLSRCGVQKSICLQSQEQAAGRAEGRPGAEWWWLTYHPSPTTDGVSGLWGGWPPTRDCSKLLTPNPSSCSPLARRLDLSSPEALPLRSWQPPQAPLHAEAILRSVCLPGQLHVCKEARSRKRFS